MRLIVDVQSRLLYPIEPKLYAYVALRTHGELNRPRCAPDPNILTALRSGILLFFLFRLLSLPVYVFF
jgi:hypothetical protein